MIGCACRFLGLFACPFVIVDVEQLERLERDPIGDVSGYTLEAPPSGDADRVPLIDIREAADCDPASGAALYFEGDVVVWEQRVFVARPATEAVIEVDYGRAASPVPARMSRMAGERWSAGRFEKTTEPSAAS